MFFDPRYFLFVMIPGILLMGFAQLRLRGAYAKYREIPDNRGLTGAQAADAVMRYAGVYDVSIEQIPGELTDHLTRARVSCASPRLSIMGARWAIGVAAHEAGHAVQQHVGYAPMMLRSGLVPVVNIGSSIGPWLVIGGLWTQITGLAWVGVILFGLATLFALVTLPVEYNASARARQMLMESGLVTQDEYQGVHSL